MATAQTSEVFNCTPEEFFKIVSDFEKYPEFLPEVKSVKITKNDGNVKEMEYSVSLVKTFKYKLQSTENSPSKVDFHFIGGDVFKTMKGSWQIAPEGADKCKVNYSVEATFGMLVPGPMANTLVSVNLPIMINNFKKRIKTVYGK
ncbi:MAG: SRPBCC family protein [Pseudobdellovibrio sp.]|nr:SRPBCC family protein [Pseudobdellovibrio sp.]